MSAILQTVKLGDIRPNPFRPPDTPINEERVERFVAEFSKSTPWRFTVRADLALPFGHHRLEAAKRTLGVDAEVEVIVEDITDAEMVRMLAQENDEEWNHDFLTGTLVSVRAYLKAYDEGVIDLTPKDPGPATQLGYTSQLKKPYSTLTLAHARRGTWLEGDRAARKVECAVALINEKLIPDKSLMGLGPAQVRAMLELARGAAKVCEHTNDADISVHKDALFKAKKEGNSNKVEQLNERIAQIEAKSEEAAEKAAEKMAKQAAERFAKGESIRAVKEDLIPQVVKKGVAQIQRAKHGTKGVVAYTREDYDAKAKQIDRDLDEEERGCIVAGGDSKSRREFIDAVKRRMGREADLLKVMKR